MVSVSNPQFGQPYSTVVDITVKVDDETLEFKKLPSSNTIADSGTVVVSDNKDDMINEIESLIRTSQDILDKVDYHKTIVDECGKMLEKLNPQLAKEKERDEYIDNLKDKISGMEDKMSEILKILSEKQIRK